MIPSPSEESKIVLAAEQESGAARGPFPSTAYREPILRALASGSSGNRSTEPFPITAFREPTLRMLAARLSER
jgi:hypothetical protein